MVPLIFAYIFRKQEINLFIILNQWKEFVIKNSLSVNTKKIDSIISIVLPDDLIKIEKDSNTLLFFKLKDSSVFGILRTTNSYQTLGLFKSKDSNQIQLCSNIRNIFVLKSIQKGKIVYKYNLDNRLISTYIGLNGNILQEITLQQLDVKKSKQGKTKSNSTTCTDWYLVTYLNGIEISRVYAFTTCDGPTMDLPDNGSAGFQTADLVLDPCQTSKNLANDSTFLTYSRKVQNENLNLGYETAYGVTLGQNNTYNYNYYYGSLNSASVSIPSNLSYYGIIHSHYLGGTLSIFSNDDVNSIIQLYNNNQIANPSTFFYELITSQGTSYMLLIEDFDKFKQFAQNSASIIGFSIFATKSITLNNSISTNETNFVDLLNKFNSGLKLFKSNSNFTSWNALSLNNGVIQSNTCQ